MQKASRMIISIIRRPAGCGDHACPNNHHAHPIRRMFAVLSISSTNFPIPCSSFSSLILHEPHAMKFSSLTPFGLSMHDGNAVWIGYLNSILWLILVLHMPRFRAYAFRQRSPRFLTQSLKVAPEKLPVREYPCYTTFRM
jgi:hypothetical protein